MTITVDLSIARRLICSNWFILHQALGVFKIPKLLSTMSLDFRRIIFIRSNLRIQMLSRKKECNTELTCDFGSPSACGCTRCWPRWPGNRGHGTRAAPTAWWAEHGPVLGMETTLRVAVDHFGSPFPKNDKLTLLSESFFSWLSKASMKLFQLPHLLARGN